MRYLMLIYWNESEDHGMTEEEREAQFTAYRSFTQEVMDREIFCAADALQSVATATTVRVRNEQTLLTNGPFAETKEHLGGFYMVDCETIEEVIELAAKIPHAKKGSIEIRPIFEY